jgi:hypothetical protein
MIEIVSATRLSEKQSKKNDDSDVRGTKEPVWMSKRFEIIRSS